MKQVALENRAHDFLGHQLIGFVRKEIEKSNENDKIMPARRLTAQSGSKEGTSEFSLEIEHSKALKASIIDLIKIEPALSGQVQKFLGTVQGTMNKQDPEKALNSIKLHDTMTAKMPRFEK